MTSQYITGLALNCLGHAVLKGRIRCSVVQHPERPGQAEGEGHQHPSSVSFKVETMIKCDGAPSALKDS